MDQILLRLNNLNYNMKIKGKSSKGNLVNEVKKSQKKLNDSKCMKSLTKKI